MVIFPLKTKKEGCGYFSNMVWDFPLDGWVNSHYCATFNSVLEFHSFWQLTVNTHPLPPIPVWSSKILSHKLHVFLLNCHLLHFVPGPHRASKPPLTWSFKTSVTADGENTDGSSEGVHAFLMTSVTVLLRLYIPDDQSRGCEMNSLYNPCVFPVYIFLLQTANSIIRSQWTW